ncbi:abc transporter cdr4 [Apiospora sp. TS-2023a]
MDFGLREEAFQRWVQQQQRKHRLQISVTFRDLECYGFASSATFQHTVASYALALPRLIGRWISTRRQPDRVQILRDFNGLVKPGEMLLVLGRPGSGCSSFLKVLSGDVHGFSVGEGVRISYSGVPYDQMHKDFKGESIYLAELDAHFAELNLGQTLGFAASAREVGLGSSTKVESQATARDVAALFGLLGAFETRMGNHQIRGVSGGETRRTSIAEALMSNAQFQCWDNSTRGLDSSTAQQFIELLRNSTRTLLSTTVMSIYQASEAMYKNFDKVTLLYEGRQVYFGPANSALEYFHDLGFKKPPRATTADFLTSLTNPAERVIRDGYHDRAPKSPDEFADTWKNSPQAKQLLDEIHELEADSQSPLPVDSPKPPTHRPAYLKEMMSLRSSTYLLPVHQQLHICLQRSFLRLRNNYVPTVSTVFANAILALVVGSVFYNLSDTVDSMDKRSVLIFFSLMICAFSPAFEVLTMWAQRPIVEKHDRYALYHPYVEGIASILSDLPAKLVTSIGFHATLYFMTNLRRTASAFFTYLVFMFFIVVTMSMVFRSLGSLSRTMEQTMAPASIVVLLCIVYTGFVIPVPYMKPWLSWFRRLNPMAYAYESLMINEFSNREFACPSTIPAGPGYSDQPLMDGKVCPVVGAEPGVPNVQGSSYLLLKYGYEFNHLWRNFGIIIAMMVIFCFVHLWATEYIPAERSKGDVLLFQRGHKGVGRRKGSSTPPEDARALPAFAQDTNLLQSGYDGAGGSSKGAPLGLKHSSVFHWDGLSYELKTRHGTKRILNNVDGWVEPGTLTALMGVTGAGKTTLLDVLANRTTGGVMSGEIHIDGSVITDASFQRRIGYVQQYVANMIRVLDMESYAEAVVGVPGSGLNIEQRKRLSIGIELVAKPELLLFLDEPTSGLDSQTAWSICMLLRKLANHGQAVLCTIHQPSFQLFQMFDRLLLLSNNGETAYFCELGHDAATLIQYLEGLGAPKCQPDDNPAEWALRVVNGGVENASSARGESDVEYPGERGVSSEMGQLSWAEIWRNSQVHRDVKQRIQQFNAAEIPTATKYPEGADGGEYAVSIIRQMAFVTKRAFQDYWRDPTYLYSKLALCAGVEGVGFFNGVSFYDTPLDMQSFIDFLFSIFLISQLFSTLDQQIIPRLADGRSLFDAREKRSKSYSWTVFLAANIAIEVFWQTVAAVIVFVAWYYLTGLWQNGDPSFGMVERGGLVFVLIWLVCLWITTFSQAVGVGIEHAETAVQIATLCFWLSLVFCGVLVQPDDLPRFWIFVYRASPLTYFIDGMVVACLANTHIRCSAVQVLQIEIPKGSLATTTCGSYLRPFLQHAGGYVENPEGTERCLYCPVDQTNDLLLRFGIHAEQAAWQNVGYMCVYVVFNILATYLIYWLARVPKRTGRRKM